MDLQELIRREIWSLNEARINAYHGSPYDFDRFDITKIGSGDGLNKFGHGLYFADREDTAEYYAKELSIGDHRETGFNIYEVLLNGDFYEWDEQIPPHIHDCVAQKLRGMGHDDDADTMDQEVEEYGEYWSMRSLYEIMEYTVDGGAAASALLVSCGVDGVIAQSPAHEGNVIVVYNDDVIRMMDKRKLGESLLKEDLASFNTDEFKNLRAFAARKRYAEENLRRIAQGTGRIVFELGADKVLKLAKNPKGVAQNEVEVNMGMHDYYAKDTVAEVFDADENHLWLIAERAKKLTPSRFFQLTGVKIQELGQWLNHMYISNNPSRYGGTPPNVSPERDAELWENEWSARIIDLMNNYDLPAGDLGRISSYGEVIRDGQPEVVITDYGLNSDVHSSHYQREGIGEAENNFNRELKDDPNTSNMRDGAWGGWALLPNSVSQGGLVGDDLNEGIADYNNLALAIDNDMYYLYDPKIGEIIDNQDWEEMEKYILGGMALRYNEKNDGMEIVSIAAEKGYGPLLYLIGMSVAGNKGLMPSRVKNEVTPEAKNVWKEFAQGQGQPYIGKTIDLLDQNHPEPYLNKKYITSQPIDTYKMFQNHQNIISNDRHGEKENSIIELGDAFLTKQIRHIYQEGVMDTIIGNNKMELPVGKIYSINEYDEFRSIGDENLKKAVDYIEGLGEIGKPLLKDISKLYKGYLVGSQNIDRALELANDDIGFFNKLIDIQALLKNFGLIKEDLVYWGADDANSDEFTIGAPINENGSSLYRTEHGVVAPSDNKSLEEDRTIVSAEDEEKLEDIFNGYLGILTPHQLENNKRNNTASKKLKEILDKFNFEYVVGIGEWDGDTDTHEQSYIVKKHIELTEKEFFDVLQMIAKKFNQQAFIFGKEGDYKLYYLNGKTENIGSAIEFGDEMFKSFDFVTEERIKSWMPGMVTPKVKKSCRLGGKKDGTSDDCSQGDAGAVSYEKLKDGHSHKPNTVNVADEKKWFDENALVENDNDPRIKSMIRQGYDLDKIKDNEGNEYYIFRDLALNLFRIWHEGKTIGHLYLSENKDGTYTPDAGNADASWIDPDFRNKGLGKEMYRYAIDQGYKIVPSEIQSSGAKGIWKSLNKVEEIVTSTIKESYINPMNEATTMTLDALPFKRELEGLGGKIFSVGGAVRDKFLGKDSKDLDILVTGIPEETLINRLQKYGKAGKHGKKFGVIKFTPTGADPNEEPIDIALPRTEVSTGAGHKNFEVKVDPTLSVEDDLKRRDFTINAMATDINGDIIDPFNGQQDLKDKIIKMTYPNSFVDDELRMLRAVQFASRFEGFEIEPETFKAIQNAASTINAVSPERWMEEFEKIVFKGDVLKGAQLLKDTGLMKAMFGREKEIPVHAVWNTIKTLGEFMYMLMIGLVEKPSDTFKNNLKGDIATMKEMKALEEMEKVTKDRRLNRGIVFQMLKLAPQTIKSGLVPDELKPAIQDLMSGGYPKGVGDLAINGNDLIALNVEPRQRGIILNSILDNIYADNLKNEKETLLNFVKTQQNVT